MNKQYNKPNGFIPYKELNIGGNIIRGGGSLISLSGNLPIIIGSGDIPKIWIKQILNNKGNISQVELVKASVSLHPAIQVMGEGRNVEIYASNQLILKTENNNRDKVDITYLDLRPIGLNIFGDKVSVNAGGMTLKGNTFNGSGALFATSI